MRCQPRLGRGTPAGEGRAPEGRGRRGAAPGGEARRRAGSARRVGGTRRPRSLASGVKWLQMSKVLETFLI